MKQGTVVKVSDVARGPFFNIEGWNIEKKLAIDLPFKAKSLVK